MKQLYITAVFLIFISAGAASAECVTGYACSIDSLKKAGALNSEYKRKAAIYKGLDRRENFMCGIIKDDLEYMDLFPFASFLINPAPADMEKSAGHKNGL